ncbi:hypothetical protein BpHYR1_050729 [Brachionus plicatilis]|uniref:Uncharacterized protein n=1 Tax=Brachionus plicatilis TaxID=10195 RepID=A0A3M7PGJ7_BRAPC|nr:hypothetical protein BpHYR1_050729 [Brachionus plicatilis]
MTSSSPLTNSVRKRLLKNGVCPGEESLFVLNQLRSPRLHRARSECHLYSLFKNMITKTNSKLIILISQYIKLIKIKNTILRFFINILNETIKNLFQFFLNIPYLIPTSLN